MRQWHMELIMARYRLKFNFWLNINDPIEEAIADTIEALKTNRLFTKTIRDGIRLVHDLRNGSLDMLFELFPYVKSEFLKYVGEVVGQVATENDIDKAHDAYQHTQHLKDMIALQNEEIERLNKALEKSRGKPSEDFEAMMRTIVRDELIRNTPQSTDTGQNSGLQPSQGIKTIGNAQPLPAPVHDDDEDDLLEVKKDTSNKASQNFLKSMMALQGIEYKD
jgi:hypothetical protein